MDSNSELSPIVAKLHVFGTKMPACPARRDVRPDQGVYFCTDPRVVSRNNMVSPEVCQHCAVVQLPPPRKYLVFDESRDYEHNGPCKYLGDKKGLRECKSCRGNVRVKVYDCHHPQHSETTIKECLECLDYQSIS